MKRLLPLITLMTALLLIPVPGVELSLTGTNLTENRHPEFGVEPGRSEIARAYFARVLWNY